MQTIKSKDARFGISTTIQQAKTATGLSKSTRTFRKTPQTPAKIPGVIAL